MNKLQISLIVAFLTLLAACGSPASRTGGDVTPVTLTTVQDADLLHRLSLASADQAVVIKEGAPVQADGEEDSAVLQALATGKGDLGLIRSGRLAKEGAASLAPLSTPFLITSDEHAIAVAHDPVAISLMTGLDKLGLVGLGVLPVGAYYPFGFGKPLLDAADYQGQRINVRSDAGWDAIMGALGAIQDQSANAERSARVRAGQLRGIPMFIQNFGAVDGPAVLTGNMALFERFDVVVVRRGAWDSLASAQQDHLKVMVAQIRDRVYEEKTAPHAEGLQDWCRLDGTSSVVANTDAVNSMHAALDPITVTVTGQYPDAAATIRRLGDGIATPVLDCTTIVDKTVQPFVAKGDQSVLDGTWRFEVTEDELLAGGASASDAHNNAGVWEMTLKSGTGPGGKVPGSSTWTFHFAVDRVRADLGDEEAVLEGTYAIRGDTVRFAWNSPEGDPYPWINKVLFAKAVRVQG